MYTYTVHRLLCRQRTNLCPHWLLFISRRLRLIGVIHHGMTHGHYLRIPCVLGIFCCCFYSTVFVHKGQKRVNAQTETTFAQLILNCLTLPLQQFWLDIVMLIANLIFELSCWVMSNFFGPPDPWLILLDPCNQIFFMCVNFHASPLKLERYLQFGSKIPVRLNLTYHSGPPGVELNPQWVNQDISWIEREQYMKFLEQKVIGVRDQEMKINWPTSCHTMSQCHNVQ